MKNPFDICIIIEIFYFTIETKSKISLLRSYSTITRQLSAKLGFYVFNAFLNLFIKYFKSGYSLRTNKITFFDSGVNFDLCSWILHKKHPVEQLIETQIRCQIRKFSALPTNQ